MKTFLGLNNVPKPYRFTDNGRQRFWSVRVTTSLLSALLFLPTINASAADITVLATFNGSDGSQSLSKLTADSSGNHFGTTTRGGTNNQGTVFELPVGATQVTTLVSFTNSNGSLPQAGLTADAGGNLYGTTLGGGTNSTGTIYKIAAGTHQFTTLASFDGTNGHYPYSPLLAGSAGNLYGTTELGGANDFGTIYKITDTGFVVTELGTVALTAFSSLFLTSILITRKLRRH